MCLAVPARIVECDWSARTAMVDLSGVSKQVSLMLLDEAEVGDYVLIHVGFALKRISVSEAEKTLALFRQAQATGNGNEIHQ